MKTRFLTLILPLAAAATLVGFTGCANTSERTAGRIIDDRMVTSRVKDALNDEKVYRFDDIRVTTHNGIVQLSGWAGTEEQKARAAELASKVEGVHEVLNNVSIKLTPTGRETGESGSPYRRETNNVPGRSDAPIRSPEPR